MKPSIPSMLTASLFLLLILQPQPCQSTPFVTTTADANSAGRKTATTTTTTTVKGMNARTTTTATPSITTTVTTMATIHPCVPSYLTFVPRGGAVVGNRQVRNNDAMASAVAHRGGGDDDNDNNDENDNDEKQQQQPTEGLELYPGQVAEIRKEQSFLEKQRKRREMDKTWLDKGITAFVEFFENIFRWEVTND